MAGATADKSSMASRAETAAAFPRACRSFLQASQQRLLRSFSVPPSRTAVSLGKSSPASPAARPSQSCRSARRFSCPATSRKAGRYFASSLASPCMRSAQSVRRRAQRAALLRNFPPRTAA